jgi:hypothetical protein
VQLLDKRSGVNIDSNVFEYDVERRFPDLDQGVVPGSLRGTLRLLTELLHRKWRCSNPDKKERMLRSLKAIGKQRGGRSHEVKLDRWDESLFKKQ